jgi:hypothetical protein
MRIWTLIDYLPWVLSAITIYQSYLVGNKDIRGWILSLVNQTLWFLWVIGSGTWGFLPLNIALTAIYVRNYRKWKREKHA